MKKEFIKKTDGSMSSSYRWVFEKEDDDFILEQLGKHVRKNKIRDAINSEISLSTFCHHVNEITGKGIRTIATGSWSDAQVGKLMELYPYHDNDYVARAIFEDEITKVGGRNIISRYIHRVERQAKNLGLTKSEDYIRYKEESRSRVNDARIMREKSKPCSGRFCINKLTCHHHMVFRNLAKKRAIFGNELLHSGLTTRCIGENNYYNYIPSTE